MRILKIYCAGKIKQGDWRTQLVPPHDESASDGWAFHVWPVKRGKACGHDYVGPFFMGDGNNHGSLSEDGSHSAGVLYGVRDAISDTHAPILNRQRVFDLCLDAIRRCDVLFAYIDQSDCYGTIAEIGWATALGKRILIAGDEKIDDLWFVYQMASEPFLKIEDPIRGLRKFLGVVDYHAYLRTAEWKAKANAAKTRAGHRCQVCNKSSAVTTLEAHHRTYERLGRELDTDITVLCRECHSKFHDKVKP